MTKTEYEKYLRSDAWALLKKEKTQRYICAGCGRSRGGLQLHHMVYPEDVWKTRAEHCCWLCDRCHEMLHRAPQKYIDMAVNEGITAAVIRAQRDEEDMVSVGALLKSNGVLKRFMQDSAWSDSAGNHWRMIDGKRTRVG